MLHTLMPAFPSPLLLPARTVTGAGAIRRIFSEAAVFGDRGIIVHGRSFAAGGRLATLQALLPPSMRVLCVEHAGGEPTLDQVEALRARLVADGAQWVVAVGGGSVMDLGKAAAGLLGSDADTRAYHGGRAIDYAGIPFLAVPTTAGTGSEATPNSVLTDKVTHLKKSIRHDRFMAATVVLDPELLADCPAHVIAHSGMDALTQAIEAFVSRKACEFSDALARQAIERIYTSLEAVHEAPAGPAAASLLEGSYMGGIALAAARLGVVHGIAHPLGALYEQPHGLICAVCLPLALELNRGAMGAKYAALTALLGGDAIETIRALNGRLGIVSPFRGHPVPARDRIITETLESGSTAANPKPITKPDVEWLLARLFED